MKYNKLGWSDLEVSEVCLGTATFGDQVNQEQAHQLLDAAIKLGINFLDTAEVYPGTTTAPETAGRSEEFVGTWLQKQDRSKIIVATKVAGYSKDSVYPGNRKVPRDDAKADCRLDRASILAACDASLRRLQTSYIDLYQLHWPDRYTTMFGQVTYDPKQERPFTPFEETVSALGELVKAGKIRYWGVCNETAFGIGELVKAADKLGVPRPVTIQNQFSLLHRTPFEMNLAESCSHYKIGLLPWSPLAMGFLTGKYLGGAKPEGARMSASDSFMYQQYKDEAVAKATEQYIEIAKGLGISGATLALAWCKSQWFIPSTLIGATKLSHLEDNVKAFDVDLSEDTKKAIDGVHVKFKDPLVSVS